MAEYQQSDFREQISAIPAQRMKSLQILTSFNNIAYPGKKKTTPIRVLFFCIKKRSTAPLLVPRYFG